MMRQRVERSHRRRIAAVAAATLLLSTCSDGSGGGDDAGNGNTGNGNAGQPSVPISSDARPTTSFLDQLDADAVVPGTGIPPSTADEPSGAFRFFCEFSHLAFDDPIVYPEQPGVSHLHMFFGNSGTDAQSSHESLRASGDSTCAGGTLNRSAYWAPAMLDRAGDVVVPDFILNYYKGMGGTAEEIAALPTLPAGLQMVAGYDMASPQTTTNTVWYCESIGPEATEPQYSQTIVPCPSGDRVIVRMSFPMCWDGTNLDAADHRRHMSYEQWDDQGRSSCPPSHPVRLPEYTIGIWWPSDGDVAGWTLSSDSMPGMTHAAGSTFHADWMGAWDPDVMATWTRHCINEMRSCNAGELGDGTSLSPPTEYAGPPAVPPPASPGG